MGLIGRIKRLNLILVREMENTRSEFGLNAASFDVLATLRRTVPPFCLSPAGLIASTMVTSQHRILVKNAVETLSRC